MTPFEDRDQSATAVLRRARADAVVRDQEPALTPRRLVTGAGIAVIVSLPLLNAVALILFEPHASLLERAVIGLTGVIMTAAFAYPLID